MSSAIIPEIPIVDIDTEGVFKYILIKVSSPNEKGEFEDKTIVRGYADCPFHTDINDKVTEQLLKLKETGALKDWRSKVLGGGKIKHDPEAKNIQVYGESQGYGKADHELTVCILKDIFKDYTITWDGEGEGSPTTK